MTPEDNFFPRFVCPSPSDGRYEYLRHTDSNRDLKYFYVLDLHQSAKLLPRLVGYIVETMRFLGPERCALSLTKGRSDDGTFEILKLLREDLEKIGITYFLNSSNLNPGVGERIEALAKFRNLALGPLINYPEQYLANAILIFLNDVSLRIEDTLKLPHQRLYWQT